MILVTFTGIFNVVLMQEILDSDPYLGLRFILTLALICS